MNVDFLRLLNDYDKNFCSKKCYLLTTYKNELLEISFNITDLYHLFGIHKICNLKSMNWIDQVRKNNFSLKKYKKDLKEALPRINNYYFLHNIFFNNKVDMLILGKDLKTNTMNLNIVFSDFTKDNKYVV